MAPDLPLHFVLLPHLAHGHLIPMVDAAKLLAQHNSIVTIITTPINASRVTSTIDRALKSGLQIQLLQLPFPSHEAGLPEGIETMDTLPSRDLFKNLLIGIKMLQEPMEELIDELQPPPGCIISDKNLAWTAETARKRKIPRLVFDGTSCFSLICTHNILQSKVHEGLSEFEPFVVPGLPDKIELTRAQLPGAVKMGDAKEVREEIRAAELAADGVVVNSFQELEAEYVEELNRVRGGKVYCIGPVSLCNKEAFDKAERGDKASIDENQCLKWLDSQKPNSVVYVCLGSLSRLTTPQLIEIGQGLEASGHPFIWVIRRRNIEEMENWIRNEGFEERTKGMGLLIRGWAPQLLILGHTAVGGFLTHCGWNSTLEGVCAGLPMATWPMFAEQFYNEKLAVQVLEIGLRVGVEFAVKSGEEEKFGVVVRRGEVKRAVKELMDGGTDGDERRKRAAELGKAARKAIEEGGSSFINMRTLVHDIEQQVVGNKNSK